MFNKLCIVLIIIFFNVLNSKVSVAYNPHEHSPRDNYEWGKTEYERGNIAGLFSLRVACEKNYKEACEYLNNINNKNENNQQSYVTQGNTNHNFNNSIINENIGTFTCSYWTDYVEHKENNRKMNESGSQDAATELIESGNPIAGVVGGVISALNLVGQAANSIDTDLITCQYQLPGKSDRSSADELEYKIKNKIIVPIYLFDGITTKFFETDDWDDIKRQDNNFIFKRNSVKSTLDYFGFKIQSNDSNRYILWQINPKNASISPVYNYDWKELNKYLD